MFQRKTKEALEKWKLKKPTIKTKLVLSKRRKQKEEIKTSRNQFGGFNTYQHSLKLRDWLVRDGCPIDFSDLIADMESGLPMYHAPMHDAGHDTPAIVC